MTKQVEIPTKFNAAAQEKALAALEEWGSIQVAAAAAGVSVKTVRHYRDNDEEFGERWEIAHDAFCAKMTKIVLEDGILKGEKVPVIGRVGKDKDGQLKDEKGEPMFTYKKSDKMKEMFVKKHMPEFNPNQQVDMTVKGGLLVMERTDLSEEEFEKLYGDK